LTAVTEKAPFFTCDDAGRFVPDDSALSPWGPDMLHGRLLAALAARAAESLGGDFVPTRLTIDLFRAAPMQPVEVTAELVRDGGRVRVVHVVVGSASRQAARASVLLLRRGTQPPGQVWQPAPWSVPSPAELGNLTPDAPERAFIDIRPITAGGLAEASQKRLWIRETRNLVAGEEPSPFVRAVGAADLANPFGNFGEQGLAFINADLTVYLGRLPVGEWIGMEVSSRTASDGVSVVAAQLYDLHGSIGHCSVGSVATGSFPGPAETST
jgi:acyl-CoA thioesterase